MVARHAPESVAGMDRNTQGLFELAQVCVPTGFGRAAPRINCHQNALTAARQRTDWRSPTPFRGIRRSGWVRRSTQAAARRALHPGLSDGQPRCDRQPPCGFSLTRHQECPWFNAGERVFL